MYERLILNIDLAAIRRNFFRLKALSGHKKAMAVIKADGYGLGGAEIARALDGYADYFGVATLDEGAALRKQNILTPVLILGYVPPDRYSELVYYNLETAVYGEENALSLHRAGLGRAVSVHVAVDTGMNRLGFRFDEYEKIRKVFSLTGLDVRGIFTHYACAGTDAGFTALQTERFDGILKRLRFDGISYGLTHSDNSDGVRAGAGNNCDMFRAGIGLYGIGGKREEGWETPIELKARIVLLKTVKKGEKIGYGCAYTARDDMKIAVIAAGYADGYPVALSGRGYVLVGGRHAPVAGRICMDYLMADVTDIPAEDIGEEAVLFGRGIDAAALDSIAGIFPYEFLCNLGSRAERIYTED